ncbi:hypothetical protein ACFQX6_04815 [Streptosporangium lutulentum]
MYAALLGEVDGVRLLTPERLREATRKSSSGIDEIFGMPSAFALGYALGSPVDQSPETVFGMAGAGGAAPTRTPRPGSWSPSPRTA